MASKVHWYRIHFCPLDCGIVTETRLLEDRAQELELIEGYIRRVADQRSPLRILEAGCGRRWPLNLDGIEYTLTGVDIDKEALEFRTAVRGDIDEGILGDLRIVDLDDGAYDVIYCSWVLEHLSNAELVLGNFARWLRPGGLLILRFPDRDSVLGFLARMTPYRLRVYVKRLLLRRPPLGTRGHGPYPVVYEPVVSRKGLRDYCAQSRFIIREECAFIGWSGAMGRWRSLCGPLAAAIGLLSLGKLEWRHLHLVYILERE